MRVDTSSEPRVGDEKPLLFVDIEGVALGTLLRGDVIGVFSMEEG